MMNNEEFERKMAFIVNQQAQFAVDIEKLHEAQAVTAQSIHATNEMVTRLAYVTNEGFKDVNAKINALIDTQIRNEDEIRSLTDSQKKTDVSLKSLADSQKETDVSLKALADSQRITDEKFRKVLDRLDRRSNGSISD